MVDILQGLGPTAADFLPRAFLAIVCGGLIGLERELKRKPAGFRTNILICLGSMLFMWLSARMPFLFSTVQAGDPGRVAAQVVTGIGFLGAGTIIHSRGHISGLTSAAMIWVVSAIGMSIGSGFLAIGVITTGLILAVQFGLGLVERRVFGRCIFHDCQIAFDDDKGRTRRQIETAIRALGQAPGPFSMKSAGDHLVLTTQYCDLHPKHKKFLSDLWLIEGVREVRPLR